MQIVIDIPPWVYESVKNGTFDAKRSPYDLEYVLKHGYPLPAKHGRLIDADKIQFENGDFDTYSDYSRAFDAIDNADTLIPAEEEMKTDKRGNCESVSGEMNIGKAYAIFKNINSDKYTVLEKHSAIRIVLRMETHNGITKADFLEVLHWIMEGGE